MGFMMLWVLLLQPAFVAAQGTDTDTDANNRAEAAYQSERERFKQAREALSEGNLTKFETLRTSLRGYPLHAFLEFEQLQQQWSSGKPTDADIDKLNDFEQRTGDASLTGRLTRTLQRRFSATEQWNTFLALSQSRFASKMSCETLKARSATGLLKGFDEAAVDLWVQPRKYSEPCKSVLADLEKTHTPPIAAIWARIFTSMEGNKPEFAKPMLGYLATKDRKQVQLWIDSAKSPKSMLESGALAEDNLLNRRILTDLIMDWSREDTKAAIEYWLKMRSNYAFYAERYYDTSRALAMRAAYRRMPEAAGWLREFTAGAGDLELQEWRIRTSLLAEDWAGVMVGLAELPPGERQEDHWAYWEARALEKMGRADEARVIYARLAKLQSYHGFLSADRIDVEYSIFNEPVELDAAVYARLEDESALVRAREFHYVDLTNESRREWNNWIKGKSEAELSAAAVLASNWGLHDRAIYSAGLSKNRRAISLRFPVLFRSEVARASMENSIEPAWIFGVMRRESAYIRDVRSSAGAIGLMQLMPNTAKYVAGLQGKKNWKGDLTDSATNIGFGTFYLRYVMDKFDDHQVLATASYNAGPSRVDQWLRESTIDADIWIDTIPFTETRRYVRAVLAYAAIYEYNLTGKAQRLNLKLRPVPAAPEV